MEKLLNKDYTVMIVTKKNVYCIFITAFCFYFSFAFISDASHIKRI